VRILAVIVVVVLGWPAMTSACMCDKDPTFATMMSVRPRVIVGRVLEQGKPYAQDDAFPPFIDLGVVAIVKGPELPIGSRIRVWDGYFTTSCAGSLTKVRTGSLVAVAVVRQADPEADSDPSGPTVTSGRKGRTLAPARDDYFLGVCGTHWETLAGEADVLRLRQQLAAGARDKR